MKNCPKCNKNYEDNVAVCDCGYVFYEIDSGEKIKQNFIGIFSILIGVSLLFLIEYGIMNSMYYRNNELAGILIHFSVYTSLIICSMLMLRMENDWPFIVYMFLCLIGFTIYFNIVLDMEKIENLVILIIIYKLSVLWSVVCMIYKHKVQ